MVNTESTLCTTPDFCQSVSQALLFGNNGNSHTVSTQSVMFIHMHILYNMGVLVRQKK